MSEVFLRMEQKRLLHLIDKLRCIVVDSCMTITWLLCRNFPAFSANLLPPRCRHIGKQIQESLIKYSNCKLAGYFSLYIDFHLALKCLISFNINK